jgi:hypothetical protein
MNNERWQIDSDDWCKAMTASKKSKEEYQIYKGRTRNPMSYIKWLRGKKYDKAHR